MAWATREIVYVYCGLQGREDSADFHNFDAGHLPDDVVDMMEVDAQVRDTSAELPNPFDSDEEDESDDEDLSDDDEDDDIPDHSNVMMQVDTVEPAPEVVGDGASPMASTADTSEEPNSSLPSSFANPPKPASAIPLRFRKLSHPLPSLFSFHTEAFEPGYVTPDGTPYVGRGTPVDKARRRDWANVTAPQPILAPAPIARYSPADESWFASLVTTPSVLSGSPASLAADTSFGVPTEVGPFCCTQDGLYGSAGPALPPDYGAGIAGPSSNAFDYPAPQPSWMDTPTFPQDLGAGFPGVGAGAPPPPPPSMADTLPHATTGCVFHSCLMDCLTSGLGCVVPPFAGMPAQMPQPLPPPPQTLVPCNVEAANPPGMPAGMDVGPYDVSMEPVAVQASSALSHALG